MQYLVSVIDDGTGSATPTEEADIDAFNDRLRDEGSKACNRKIEVRPFL